MFTRRLGCCGGMGVATGKRSKAGECRSYNYAFRCIALQKISAFPIVMNQFKMCQLICILTVRLMTNE
jgi:hypothetical protein